MPSPLPAPPPYASPTLSGVVSTGTQSFGGEKTFVDQATVSSGIKFGDNTVQVTAYLGGASVAFSAPEAETITPGNLVTLDSSGQVLVADATLTGRYPAVGVCVDSSGGTSTILPVGPASVFSGLTPGTAYFLGTAGSLVTTPPPMAKVSQTAVQAITATSGVLVLTSSIIYL